MPTVSVVSPEVMKVQSIDHLNLTVANLEESIAWYADIFGFEVVERGERDSGPWAIIRSGDALLCIYQDLDRVGPARFRHDPEERHVIYHWGFRITDRAAWLQKVEEHGLHLEFGGENVHPHSSNWSVTDPTGYSIEVALWKNNTIWFDRPRAVLQGSLTA